MTAEAMAVQLLDDYARSRHDERHRNGTCVHGCDTLVCQEYRAVREALLGAGECRCRQERAPDYRRSSRTEAALEKVRAARAGQRGAQEKLWEAMRDAHEVGAAMRPLARAGG